MCAKRRSSLALMLDRSSDSPLHEQIYGAVGEAIRTGRIRAGETLPSVRQLSGDLGVSHTIVEQAYLELTTEGYIRSKPRSGYVVERIETSYFNVPDREAAVCLDNAAFEGLGGLRGEEEDGSVVPYDFSYTRLRPGSFPLRAWRRACAEALKEDDRQLIGYQYNGRALPLQNELSRYLSQARGIECDPRQILLEAGSAFALFDLFRLFDATVDCLGMEEPGWRVPCEVADTMGFAVEPLDVMSSSKDADRLFGDSRLRLLFLTPSHQFPTGKVMPLAQRVRVLEWADDHDAFLIEDDSCFEYRYDMRPIPSLFSLDNRGRTVYLGNFSKVLSPGIRLAYLVLPPQLLERHLRLFPSDHPGVSSFDATVLAHLMVSGDYDRHVGRMVHANRRCHDELLRCLTTTFGDMLTISGKHSGMHLYVRVHNGMTTDELIRSAFQQGAKVYSTCGHWFSRPPQEGVVMIGFSAIEAEAIPAGVAALARAWL